MKIKSNIIMKTNVKIIARDLQGKIIDVQEYHNIITNVGLNLLRDALNGDATDLEIKYMAWGSDNTGVNVAQTTLISETDRKQITSQAAGATGIMVTTIYIAPYEAVAPPDIEELGWFCGPDADDDADHGIMISRILYSRTKTELESLQIVRTDTFTEV